MPDLISNRCKTKIHHVLSWKDGCEGASILIKWKLHSWGSFTSVNSSEDVENSSFYSLSIPTNCYEYLESFSLFFPFFFLFTSKITYCLSVLPSVLPSSLTSGLPSGLRLQYCEKVKHAQCRCLLLANTRTSWCGIICPTVVLLRCTVVRSLMVSLGITLIILEWSITRINVLCNTPTGKTPHGPITS